MKSAISLPVVALFTLTSTVSAAPQSTPASTTKAASQTALNGQQWSAIKSYASAQATKSDFSSVNHVLSTAAVPAPTMSKEENEFRKAALTTNAPELPGYLSDTNPKASAYLSSYYMAQASLINKGVASKDSNDSSTAPAQLLPNITGTKKSSSSSKPTTMAKASEKSQTPTTTGAKRTKSDDDKPKSTSTKKGSKTTGSTTGTASASSSSSSGAAAMAQPTGVMKMAGVGALGVAGVAAFL